MTERLLKTLGIAELLDVSPVTVKRWRAIGWGPPWIRLRGERGGIRYPESEYEKWVAENSNRSLADEYAKRPQQEAPSSPKATPTFSMKDGKQSVRRGG
jgi:hypothetical protein